MEEEKRKGRSFKSSRRVRYEITTKTKERKKKKTEGQGEKEKWGGEQLSGRREIDQVQYKRDASHGNGWSGESQNQGTCGKPVAFFAFFFCFFCFFPERNRGLSTGGPLIGATGPGALGHRCV